MFKYAKIIFDVSATVAGALFLWNLALELAEIKVREEYEATENKA